MKNRGFTLVEVLAVIVVLGVIIAIAVPNIIMSSKKSKESMYDTKVNMIEKAAELYGNDNFDSVNKSIEIVPLSKLLNDNYLKKESNNCSGNNCITDPRTNEGMANQNVCVCTVNKSVVAEFIGTKNNGSGTMCDSSNIDNPVSPDPTNPTATQYTLTYDSQGGSSCTSKSVTAGSTWGTLCSPTKDGYSFSGWYTGTNGSGTNVTSNTTATGNLTVYAKWNNNGPTLTISLYSRTNNTINGTVYRITHINRIRVWGPNNTYSDYIDNENKYTDRYDSFIPSQFKNMPVYPGYKIEMFHKDGDYNWFIDYPDGDYCMIGMGGSIDFYVPSSATGSATLNINNNGAEDEVDFYTSRTSG